MILSLIHNTGVFQSECIKHCSVYSESGLHHEQVVEMDFAYFIYLNLFYITVITLHAKTVHRRFIQIHILYTDT